MQTTNSKGATLDPASHVPAEPVAATSGNNGTSRGRPSERSLANLRMFKPGQSGNPSGRPKGIFTKSALRQLRKRNENGERNVDSIVLTQIEMAKEQGKLSTRAAEFLRDTTDGPPVREHESINVGTVNVMFAGTTPEWALPQTVAIDAVKVAPPIIGANTLPEWARAPVTLAERVDKFNDDQPINGPVVPCAKKSDGVS